MFCPFKFSLFLFKSHSFLRASASANNAFVRSRFKRSIFSSKTTEQSNSLRTIHGNDTIERPESIIQLLENFKNKIFSGDEYDYLTNMGLLEGVPVELIDGQLVFMAAHSIDHIRSADRLHYLFFTELRLKKRAHVRKAEPVSLKGGSWQPEPDVCVVSGTDRDYDNRKPTSKDILLVVEISVSTLNHNKNKKLTDYASEGIMEYWIVQPEKRKVRVLRNPEGSSFKSDETISHGTIAPYAFPDCNLSLDDIF